MEFRTIPMLLGDLVDDRSIDQNSKDGLGSESGQESSLWVMLSMRTSRLSETSS